MRYNYDDIAKAILTQNLEMLLTYNKEQYWLLIEDDCYFGDDKGIISLKFKTPEMLLLSILVDNKKLSEMWNDVEVDSYDVGWGKGFDSRDLTLRKIVCNFIKKIIKNK